MACHPSFRSAKHSHLLCLAGTFAEGRRHGNILIEFSESTISRMEHNRVAPTKFSLRDLTSFGDVAAEDDSVLDYFLKTDAVARIQNNELFLILGRKGSGKTALV